jgi:hypothetical protein
MKKEEWGGERKRFSRKTGSDLEASRDGAAGKQENSRELFNHEYRE